MSQRRFNVLSILLSLLFLVAGTVLGALLGGIVLKLFVEPASNGWDGIAQGLGALMIGALVGIVAAVLALIPLLRRGQMALLRAFALVGALVVLLIGGLRWAMPREEPPEASPRPTPTQPTSPPADS